MDKNVGTLDKYLRIVVGLIFVYLGISGSLILLAVAGVIVVLTGLMNQCLIYRLFGISTCKTKSDSKPKPDDQEK